MNKQEELFNLIKDYIACSKYVCRILKDSFDTRGETILRARKMNLIPKEGLLPEGYFFNFHGGGCYFKLSDILNIDIDFGPDDRCDGFDSQRLWEFRESSKKTYLYLESEEDVVSALEILLEKEVIVNPGWYPNPHLYYLTGSYSLMDPVSI